MVDMMQEADGAPGDILLRRTCNSFRGKGGARRCNKRAGLDVPRMETACAPVEGGSAAPSAARWVGRRPLQVMPKIATPLFGVGSRGGAAADRNATP